MKKIYFVIIGLIASSTAFAQSAVDAYRLSQPDLKGTARYMSMAGAFGALGGDLSTLSHNPAGIGVYRNSEVGFTLDLDLQNSESNSSGIKNSIDQTKFLLNNIGLVMTMKLPSSTCPNLNFGFTYNKSASFNRRYRGAIGLNGSLSNYIANITTEGGYVPGQLLGDEYNGNDPYNPTDPNDAAPWLSILGYDGYLFTNQPLPSSPDTPNYVGQWGSQTSGIGYFNVQESGTVNSYNIALGGNISNVVFWGMDFDITHLNYTLTPEWTEDLVNARVGNNDNLISLMNSSWRLSNYYNCSGTGFNYKLGFIVKPIQEFRLGFAFETPTWYNLTESFYADIDYQYGDNKPGSVTTNDGYIGTNSMSFRTPWKLNISAAAVLFNRLIISGEYEWAQYKKMKFSNQSYFGGDYWYPDDYYPWDYPWDYYSTGAYDYNPYISNDPYYYTNKDISEMYCNTNTLRLGAEFRVTPQFSVRAGYSFVSSPVNSNLKNAPVETAGTIPNYRLDNTTNYVSCGLGYKFHNFYVDLAYVYKRMDSEYHAYSSWYPSAGDNYNNLMPIESPKSSLSFNNSQIVLSAGFKF